MDSVAQEALNARKGAEQIHSAAEVEAALDRMAAEITADVADANPIMLCVMTGALIPMGLLLPRLDFLLRIDYLHASRYRERTFGTDITWKKHHELSLQGETVVVIDDIFDEGLTLEAIVRYCRNAGARQVRSAVLINKQRARASTLSVDYVGLTAPDRYLFGYGMDYKGYWRNLPGIYAV
jgi:hypoxanthine phosphoribosyltransferase